MAKVWKPLFSFNARGTLAKALTFRRRGHQVIAETKPIPKDAKTSSQLAWRTMYQKCTDLWHTLSGPEKQTWEALARRQHMTGYNYYMSLCLKPNPGIYLPLAGGTMQGNINMATNRILALPAPVADEEPLRKIDGGGGSTTFLGLTDTPATYAGQAGKFPQVNAGGNALEWIAHKNLTTGVHGVGTKGVAHKISPRCKVYRATSAQSIPDATDTKIQYNAEDYDNFNEFDPTTNFRFTGQEAGWHLILGGMQIEVNEDQNEYAHKVFKNGAEYAIHINTTAKSSWGIIGVFYLVYLNGSTDYLEFYAFQHGPGVTGRNLTASISRNFVEIFKLG